MPDIIFSLKPFFRYICGSVRKERLYWFDSLRLVIFGLRQTGYSFTFDLIS